MFKAYLVSLCKQKYSTSVCNSLACVVGVQRGGRGENKKREARSEGGAGERLQGRYFFLRFLRPPDQRKNPDWSELIMCLNDCPDCSEICHSST